MLWRLLPRRKARECVQIGMGHPVGMRPPLQDSVLVDSHSRAMVPPMAFILSRRCERWRRHGVLVAPWWTIVGRWWTSRGVDGLDFGLEAYSRLVSANLFGLGLDGLMDLVCPSTSPIPRRSDPRTIELETSQPSVKTHVPLCHIPPTISNGGR